MFRKYRSGPRNFSFFRYLSARGHYDNDQHPVVERSYL